MKIFYAIQGTGNGHISRAIQLYPYLQTFGEVDFFLSGSNAQLNYSIPIKYKSKGVSLYYKEAGGLDYIKIAKSLSLNLYSEAKQLPIENYDLIVNDFEFVTSLACSIKKKPCIHFGHQASFQSNNTPRAKTLNPIGNLVLKNFVKSKNYLGLHFSPFDKHIYNPIIKDEIINASITNDEHITVYLPQYANSYLEPYLLNEHKVHFEVFTKEVSSIVCNRNITYFPINNKTFTQSLIRSNGIITAGGFETPAEAMYLNKKIISIPIKQHFEQACNAAALKKMGITVIDKLDSRFSSIFDTWMHHTKPIKLNLTHSTADIVNILMNTSPHN
jgi:uncharacterized protein (TIGR00661 family)